MKANSDGFELTFTKPLDTSTAGDLKSYSMKTYTYIYQADYGSPVVDATTPTITKVTVGQDKKSVRLYVKGLQEGHIHDLKTPGVKSADSESVLHPQAYYTLNYIPKE